MTVWRSFFTPWSVALFWSALCICSCDTIYPTARITVCNCIFVCFSLLLSVPDTAWALFESFQLTFLLYLLIQQPAVCRCGLQAPVLRCTIYLLLLSLLPLSGMISGTSWPIPKSGVTREGTTCEAAWDPWRMEPASWMSKAASLRYIPYGFSGGFGRIESSPMTHSSFRYSWSLGFCSQNKPASKPLSQPYL